MPTSEPTEAGSQMMNVERHYPVTVHGHGPRHSGRVTEYHEANSSLT
jgi:hypothetical protein